MDISFAAPLFLLFLILVLAVILVVFLFLPILFLSHFKGLKVFNL